MERSQSTHSTTHFSLERSQPTHFSLEHSQSTHTGLERSESTKPPDSTCCAEPDCEAVALTAQSGDSPNTFALLNLCGVVLAERTEKLQHALFRVCYGEEWGLATLCSLLIFICSSVFCEYLG